MHKGKRIWRDTKTHVLVLCPVGHLIHAHPLKEWAGSACAAERSFDKDKIVECDGAMPEGRE